MIVLNNLSNNTRAFVKATGRVYKQAKHIIAKHYVSLWSICLSVATPGGSDFREHIFTFLKILTLDYVQLKLLLATSILNLSKDHAKTHLKYLFQHFLESNIRIYKFSTCL